MTHETTGMRIAVTGASGLVGAALVPYLQAQGHTVLRLVRAPPKQPDEVQWDVETGRLDVAALQGIDAAVHLAGENIGDGRWTDERRQRILRSRVEGGRALSQALVSLRKTPRVLLSVSAVGFYGDTGDREVEEGAPSGQGFLAEVCRVWESAADPARSAGIRVVHPRLGVVLSERGGALAKMLPAFRMGLGGPIGGGRQWMSWISLVDVVRVLDFALHEERLVGPVNAVAPGTVRQGDFAQVLGNALHRPAIVPLPAFAVKLMFGAMGEALLLQGQRVVPRTLRELGFGWQHPELAPVLAALLEARPET